MKELISMMNKEYLLTEGEFTFTVLVNDVKQSYGQNRAHVTPVNGTGSAWVACYRLMKVGN